MVQEKPLKMYFPGGGGGGGGVRWIISGVIQV